MVTMKIQQPQPAVTGYTPFALGFRPFFLAAAFFSVILFPLWLGLFWQGENIANYYQDSLGWHRHEMIYGYTMAVIAGFLLTAVTNWTNQPTPSGAPLALLFLLWLCARIMPLFNAPDILIAVIDLLFAPLLALIIALPTWRSRQHSNQIFPFILILIGAANTATHLELLGFTTQGLTQANQTAPFLMLWILIIMAGRVIPFFIERATQGFQRRSWKMIETLSPATLLLLMAAQFFTNPSLISLAAALAAVVHLIRLTGWYSHQLWREPLIWVLWLGYLWLVIGFALHALAVQGVIPLNLALHAYFVGALGVLTLGMMARVALGHSGRKMHLTHRAMSYAFVMLNIAAVCRVFIPLLPLDYYWTLGLAGTLWCIAFIIFLWFYTPILLKARVDGQPG